MGLDIIDVRSFWETEWIGDEDGFEDCNDECETCPHSGVDCWPAGET